MGSINSLTGASNTSILNLGLDVPTIVDGLMQIERQPIRNMQSQISTLKQKTQAFQALNTKVSALLTQVNTLFFGTGSVPFQVPYSFEDRFSSSVLASRKAVSSDESAITATASQGLGSGTYSISVSSLAQAKSMASGNFADIDTTTVGTGKLTIQVGSNTPVEITLDASNNTLDGLRKAINAANAGVSATIINDGSASPYRLLLTSNETGIANDFQITETPTGGQALNLTQTVAASDAQINVNGVDISKSSNTITDVIEGVSFTVKAQTAAPVSLSISRDIDSMVNAFNEWVTAYNDLNAFINDQFTYDAVNNTVGILSGDSTLRRIQSSIQQRVTQAITNDYTDYRIITQLGLSFNNDGSITLNEAKLRTALADDASGVAGLLFGNGTPGTPENVTTSDARVDYDSKTSATQPGMYDIAVTALAQQASLTGSRTIGQLNQDEVLTISSGTATASINLLLGDSLTVVLDKINTGLASEGIAAIASDDGSGHIKITTNAYGSDADLTVVSDTADMDGSTGFGTTVQADYGTDIEGTINGHTAVGNGLRLIGAMGQPEEGLILTINQSDVGSYGSVNFTAAVEAVEGAGVIVNLRSALKNITDPLSGPIHNATEGLNSNIKILNDQILAYEDILAVREQMLLKQYTMADQALKLLSVSLASLNGQLSSLSSMKP